MKYLCGKGQEGLYEIMGTFRGGGRLGFEPRFHDPESCVLVNLCFFLTIQYGDWKGFITIISSLKTNLRNILWRMR